MPLVGVAMVAADTSRTRAYLHAMERHDVLPAFVLVLVNESEGSLPGQFQGASAHGRPLITESDPCWSELAFDPAVKLEEIFDRNGISYEFAPSHDINDPALIEAIRGRPETTCVYSGFGGVILRAGVLSAGMRFLHIHGGYLPTYKGSTTNYYSLLADNEMGASAIFMTQEIDGGPVLLQKSFPAPRSREEIDHYYDSAARAKVLVDTLKDYVTHGEWRTQLPENTLGEMHYIIHPVLKHLAILGTK